MPDITIQAADGGSFGAYIATPASGSGPGVVVIQEIFGVNPNIRSICDSLAEQGYIACAPDLFWRQEPGVQLDPSSQDDWNKAFGFLEGFDYEKGVGDIGATIAHVRGSDGCSGKVGAVGYCLGGSLAYMTACFTDADASVGYYPVQIEGHMEHAANAQNPCMLHIAAEDGFCPKEAQETIISALADNAKFTTHRYDGVDHAFAREGGDHYDAAAADLANGRTAEFFQQNLG